MMGSRYFSRRCVGAAQPLLHIRSRSPTTSRKVAPRSIQRHIFIHCITILSKQATCGPPAARCHLSAHGLCLLFLHSHLIVCMSSWDSYSGSELDLCSTMRSACKCELVIFFIFFSNAVSVSRMSFVIFFTLSVVCCWVFFFFTWGRKYIYI